MDSQQITIVKTDDRFLPSFTTHPDVTSSGSSTPKAGGVSMFSAALGIQQQKKQNTHKKLLPLPEAYYVRASSRFTA